VDVELGLATAAQLSKQLSSAHASGVVSIFAQDLAGLVEAADLRAQPLVELDGEAVIAEASCLEELCPVGFFFMRFSMRQAPEAALAPEVAGRTDR